jgi:hypothetical protein
MTELIDMVAQRNCYVRHSLLLGYFALYPS